MLVKNIVSWAGENFAYHPGEEIELPDDIAKARIKAGLAAALDNFQGSKLLPSKRLSRSDILKDTTETS